MFFFKSKKTKTESIEETDFSSEYINFQNDFSSREKEMVSMAVDLKNYKGLDKIEPLEKLISYYYTFKNECYSKGYGSQFSEYWEHCHNSKNPNFEYIKPYEEQLERLKKKMNR